MKTLISKFNHNDKVYSLLQFVGDDTALTPGLLRFKITDGFMSYTFYDRTKQDAIATVKTLYLV